MKKLISLLFALAAMTAGKRVMAQEAYAVYTSGNSTLAFYYDNEKSNREGDKYSLNTNYETPGWIADGKQFEKVVFAQSFSNYRPTSTFEWFNGQTSLQTITNINYLKTDNVTNMESMFWGCISLTSLNVSGFKTSNVTRMEYVFGSCRSLKSLDLSKWDTGKAISMKGMFQGCSSLTTLDVSSFDTHNVTDMFYMFSGCSSLTTLDVSGFDTRNVLDMQGVFWDCRGLTSLDLSGFDTGKATNTSQMFQRCRGLTSLDLSSFDTRKVTRMDEMFSACSNLTSIFVGHDWNTDKVESSASMFSNCTNLVGEKGTTYDANHTDVSYAHIDGGPSNPGYLSHLVKKYNLMVLGEQVTGDNKDNVHGTSFDPSTNTLTLDNFYLDTQEESEFGINNNNEMSPLDYDVDVSNLTIHVKGDNTIRTTAACLYLKDVNLTITGPGKLNLTSFSNNAINVNHSTLTLDNAKVYAKGNASAIRGRNGSQMTVNHSSLEACSAEETQATILDFNSVELINSYYEDVINNSDVLFYGEYIYYNNGAQALWYDGEYGIDEGFGGMESYDYYYLYKVLISPTAMTPTTVDASRLNDKGQMINDKGRDGWYTLDGRRLDGVPTAKGVYVRDGRKVVIQ